jgi:peptidyl-dipeptidase Dcp
MPNSIAAATPNATTAGAPLAAAGANPLLAPWDTPHGLPPFAAVQPAHFRPAFDAAWRAHRDELDAIAANPRAPDFENTVAAFDRAGELLTRINTLFGNLAAAETSPELQAVERDVAPLQAAHDSATYMHPALFARIDALHARRDALGLDPEQLRLLERVHLDFVRAGAKLAPAAQQRYAAIVERLATLTTQFAQNVLADEAGFRLVLSTEADLAGLPDWLRDSARQAARDRGLADAWVITLSMSSVEPFLTYSERRDLREQAETAWSSRGGHAGASDNRPLVAEILRLRLEQARLHGYASYADYALADRMARTPPAVDALLERVWAPAKARAAAEVKELSALAREHGHDAPVERWDWRYWAEKVRQTHYRLNDAEVMPYFSLDAMTAAMFDCANRLFGISFVPQPAIGTYHPDVHVYEVRGRAGELVGIFLADNFARTTKTGGAWMSEYRLQSRNPERVLPIIANHNNFARAGAGEATLLSLDDARTLFHEFGHGLHGLLSDVRYRRLSGTSVLSDFVELPSQLFEHWLLAPEVLARHARHHRTGAPMPADLIERIRRAHLFNKGFETVQYVASALVDMAAHELTAVADDFDAVEFERRQVESWGVPAGTRMRHRMTHFGHLFSGDGYAAGYYVYLWAEVLDADAFDAFVEAGDPFDAGVADRLRRFIYGSGNSLPPDAAYRAFRGRDPDATPMLRKKGLLGVEAE